MKQLLKRLPLLVLIAVLAVGMYAFPSSAEEGSEGNDQSTVTDPSDEGTTTDPEEPVKEGLVKEDGVYHYYVNGEAVASTWKKVTTSTGKTYKYYFGKNTAACSGLKKIGSYYYYFSTSTCRLYTPSAKKIITVNGKKYLLGTAGKLIQGWDSSKKYYFGPKYVPLTGVQVIPKGSNDTFYVFGSTGKLNATRTKLLQSVSNNAHNGKSSAKLLKYLKKWAGKPLKIKKAASCFGPGKNLFYYYKNFIVYTYKEGSKEINQGQSSRVIETKY